MNIGKIYPDTTHFTSGRSLVCCLHERFITKCDNIWHSSRWAWRCHRYSSLISVAARTREATLRSACHQPSYIGISEIKMRNNNFMKWRLCASPKPRVQVKSQAFWGQVWSQVLSLCLSNLSATRVPISGQPLLRLNLRPRSLATRRGRSTVLVNCVCHIHISTLPCLIVMWSVVRVGSHIQEIFSQMWVFADQQEQLRTGWEALSTIPSLNYFQ